MLRQTQIIERKTYCLSFEEVRRAIHFWLDESQDTVLPIDIDLCLSEEGATLVWDSPRSDT